MDTKYAEQNIKSNKGPGSYFGFDKFDVHQRHEVRLKLPTNGVRCVVKRGI